MQIGMIVIDAVVDDADLDACTRVVLPSLYDIDASGLIGQAPLPVRKVRVRRQRVVPGRGVERLPMNGNVVQHRVRGALSSAARSLSAGFASTARRAAATRRATALFPAGRSSIGAC